MAPRSTFYIALKETSEYDAVFLEDLTVAELTKRLAQCIGIQVQPPSGFFLLPRGLYLKFFCAAMGQTCLNQSAIESSRDWFYDTIPRTSSLPVFRLW